jgi:hypothetical protein
MFRTSPGDSQLPSHASVGFVLSIQFPGGWALEAIAWIPAVWVVAMAFSTLVATSDASIRDSTPRLARLE